MLFLVRGERSQKNHRTRALKFVQNDGDSPRAETHLHLLNMGSLVSWTVLPSHASYRHIYSRINVPAGQSGHFGRLR